ncbi:uncharacterized protein RSE6_08466 [Rhynchosporium secalis]|uniref:Uncharacterized protein n=1 Tax=Rhynchosporium secalis TaxID=38038 RepID=A0A1E1MFH7_RHYSE|nr:uncharacterized protein RSE6_08466 [Rhynchosporium secalis]
MGKFDHDVMLDTFYENDGKFPDTEVVFYPGVAAHILQRQQLIEICYMYWWDFATFIPDTMQAHNANI